VIVSAGAEKRLLLVWLALSAVTLAQLGVGSLDVPDAARSNAAITSAAIGIAFVKVRIIFREFMEVRHAPAWLCRLTDLWVAVAGVSLLGAYFVGMTLAAGR
jgi:hypothetical protein